MGYLKGWSDLQKFKKKEISAKKKDGFVLALAVVILGVALTVASLLIALGAIQVSNNNLLSSKVENQILCEQVEYDFLNLSEEKFINHLINLGAIQDNQNDNNFKFENKIAIKVLNNFKKIEIYEIKDGVCILEVYKS